jgi:hypothetical protein
VSVRGILVCAMIQQETGERMAARTIEIARL